MRSSLIRTTLDHQGKTAVFRACETLNVRKVDNFLEDFSPKRLFAKFRKEKALKDVGQFEVSQIPYLRATDDRVFCNAIGAALNSKKLLIGNRGDVINAIYIAEALLGIEGKVGEERQKVVMDLVTKNLKMVFIEEEKIQEKVEREFKSYFDIHRDRFERLSDKELRDKIAESRERIFEELKSRNPELKNAYKKALATLYPLASLENKLFGKSLESISVGQLGWEAEKIIQSCFAAHDFDRNEELQTRNGELRDKLKIQRGIYRAELAKSRMEHDPSFGIFGRKVAKDDTVTATLNPLARQERYSAPAVIKEVTKPHIIERKSAPIYGRSSLPSKIVTNPLHQANTATIRPWR